MRLLSARTARICLFLVAIAMALPAAAGGLRSKSTVHRGHAVSHHGVASFYRNARGLPDGVKIFNRHIHAQPAHATKPAKHKPAGKPPGNAKLASKSRGKVKKHTRTRKAGDRGGKKNLSKKKRKRHYKASKKKHKRHHKVAKRKHKRHHKKHVTYASSVYVVRPTDEYILSDYGDDQDCRYLTERGYDLSGRRVLVEWTLCFDEQGEAYVPADGRRIIARY